MEKQMRQLFSSKRTSGFSFIFLCLYLLFSVSADDIFASAPAGVTFGRRLREPKYKLEFHAENSPFHPMAPRGRGRPYQGRPDPDDDVPDNNDDDLEEEAPHDNTGMRVLRGTTSKHFSNPEDTRLATDLLRARWFQPWAYWKEVPADERERLWQQFIGHFTCSNEDLPLIRRTWEATMQRRITGIISQERAEARRLAKSDDVMKMRQFKPSYMPQDVWNVLLDRTSEEAFKRRSEAARKNRLTLKEGEITKHTAGSIPFTTYRERMVSEDGTVPSQLEVFKRTHMKKGTESYIDARSKKFVDNEQESVMMTNEEGRNYICFLPIVEETKPVKLISHSNSTSIVLETDRRIKLKTPDELIEVIKDKYFYRHEGWWSYEFCHQKHVRQLHLEDDKPVQEFVMGVFDPEATAELNQNQSDVTLLKDPRSKDASQRYHAHVYTNGTVCDLTNQRRETEIRFVCSEPSVVISSVKEISTCKYVVMVQCPMLCKHPMFQQERPIWQTIHCNEVPRDAEAASGEDLPKRMQIRVVADDSEHVAT